VSFERAPRSRQTVVTLGVAPNDAGVTQPAEIQKGLCAVAGATTAYTLNEVDASQSITTLDVSRRLLFDGSYSIIVHVSADDPTIMACVNIPARHDRQGGGPHRNQPVAPPTPPPSAS
ncbi:MAG: hypothetical protein ACR2PL_22440, partial [Dehalococcoidia bacterium]